MGRKRRAGDRATTSPNVDEVVHRRENRWDTPRNRFIDGQAECALRRHLDSFGPDTPMRHILDSCRVRESHNEAAVRRHDGSDRNSPRAVYQVTEDSWSPAVSTESEMLDEVIRRLLPTPTVPPPKAVPIPSDRELLIQRLLGVTRPPQPVIQERSKLTDMEIMLQNLLPVCSVVEEDVFLHRSLFWSL